MKIGFIYNARFNILSTFQEPVSNSIIAITHLAIELAKLGHDVTIFSQTEQNISAFGVRGCRINISNQILNLDEAILEPNYDALIIKNDSAEFLISIKNSLPTANKLFLWTEYDYLEPINQGLHDLAKQSEITGIICASNWQRARLVTRFQIMPQKIITLHHAVTPEFENLFVDAKEFISLKSKIPLLAYTGSALSGLEIFLEAFGDVRNSYPNAVLDVYARDEQTEEAQRIYKQIKANKGINLIANLSTIKLAGLIRAHNMLVFPSLVEEAYNTDILNAMAAGLYVITSDSGCIPEYCFEHGKCIVEKKLHNETLDGFVGQTLAICQTQIHNPEAFYDYCFKQLIFVNKNHTWRIRAREWEQALRVFLQPMA